MAHRPDYPRQCGERPARDPASPDTPGPAARCHGQRRHGQDDRRGRACPRPGRQTAGARCWSRSRDARASPSSSAPPRCRTRNCPIARGPGGGEVLALAVDAEEALLEYLDMFYNSAWPAGRCARSARSTSRPPSPRCPRCTAHRQGQGSRHPHAGRAPGLRRRGARRAPDRPDRPIPQCHGRDRPAREGRPDQDPERGGRGAAALTRSPRCIW